MQKFRRILVAVDGSETAARAISMAKNVGSMSPAVMNHTHSSVPVVR